MYCFKVISNSDPEKIREVEHTLTFVLVVLRGPAVEVGGGLLASQQFALRLAFHNLMNRNYNL